MITVVAWFALALNLVGIGVNWRTLRKLRRATADMKRGIDEVDSIMAEVTVEKRNVTRLVSHLERAHGIVVEMEENVAALAGRPAPPHSGDKAWKN